VCLCSAARQKTQRVSLQKSRCASRQRLALLRDGRGHSTLALFGVVTEVWCRHHRGPGSWHASPQRLGACPELDDRRSRKPTLSVACRWVAVHTCSWLVASLKCNRCGISSSRRPSAIAGTACLDGGYLPTFRRPRIAAAEFMNVTHARARCSNGISYRANR
jgi:hypothetical protein